VLTASADAKLALYKFVQGAWRQVVSTSRTEVRHVSTGGGTYVTVVQSPDHKVQNYSLVLTVK
jgi:hypothetical protein